MLPTSPKKKAARECHLETYALFLPASTKLCPIFREDVLETRSRLEPYDGEICTPSCCRLVPKRRRHASAILKPMLCFYRQAQNSAQFFGRTFWRRVHALNRMMGKFARHRVANQSQKRGRHASAILKPMFCPYQQAQNSAQLFGRTFWRLVHALNGMMGKIARHCVAD